MTLIAKWKDQRYQNKVKYTQETITDDIVKTYNMIWKQKGEKEAIEFIKYHITTRKNRQKLISIEGIIKE